MVTTIVSVDLDDIGCYHAIHGLAAPAPNTEGVVLERCLPRFLELFAETGVLATFFVIGRDLARDRSTKGTGSAILQCAARSGHELANHSYAHAYDLVRGTPTQIFDDLRRCDGELRAIGSVPVGFRAPGYTHSTSMLKQVAALGYRYDSSLLPAPAYYFARLGAIAMKKLRGRTSASQARGLSSFVGSTRAKILPDIGLWEVPISVSRRLRLPLVGTFLLGAPAPVAAVLREQAATQSYVHLQFHGIDLCDPEIDGIDAKLIKRQPELRHSLKRRQSWIKEILRARGGATTIASGFTVGATAAARIDD